MWPITRDDVQGHLGVIPAGDRDTIHLDRVVAAVTRFVERHHEPEVLAADVEDLELGAVLLAARLYARRGSPLGVASFGELGTAYVQRHDPDILSMLRLDRPGVG